MVEERSLGLLSRQLVLSLYLPAALLALGDSLVTPVSPIFTKQFEVGVAAASLVFVMVNVGALVAAFSTGYPMDTIGRRPVLLAGPLIMAAGSLMTPFAGSFTQLLCWRLVVGAAHRAAGVDGDACDLRGHRRARRVWVRVPLPGGLRADGRAGRGDGAGGHARAA